MASQGGLSARTLIAILAIYSFAAPISAQEKSEFRYLSSNFSLTDVNINKLLNRLSRVGVTIPFSLEGKASADLRIQVPINALREIQAYRFNGTISSARLKVAGLELLNVEMAAVYRDGVLELSPLEFQVPDTDPKGLPPGTFRGTGRMELVPRGELSLNLSLDGVPARSLSGIISQPAPLTAGQLMGSVEAQVPATMVRDISAWTANGQFSASGLKALDRELRRASFGFVVESGDLRINDLTGTMDGASLAGTAQANLTGDTPYSANLNLTVSDLGKLVPGIERFRFSEPLQATADVSGTLSPLTYRVGGEATFPETNIGRLAVNSGNLKYSVTEDAFAINRLDLRLYGGAFTGNANLPRAGEDSGRLNLKLDPALDLRLLAADLSGESLPLVGQIAGTVTAQVPRTKLGDPNSWQAALDVSIQEGTAWGLSIQEAAIKGTLQKGVLSLADTELHWANSQLEASGQLQLAEPQKFNAQVKLLAGDISDLNRLSAESRFARPLAGRIEANANLKGQLEDLAWQADGKVVSRQLSIDKVQVDLAEAEIAATTDIVTLKQFELDLYGGKAMGRGQYPLNDRDQGEFQFDWERINVGALLQAYLETATPVTGDLAGQAKATLGPKPDEGERKWSAKANFKIPIVTIGTVESANFQGDLNYQNERLKYAIGGKLFDGDFKLDGEYPAEAPDSPMTETSPGQGQIHLNNLQMRQVWRAFTGNPQSTDLAGTLSLSFHWSSAEGQTPGGTGSVDLRNLAWNGQALSERLTGLVEVRGNHLIARAIQGTLLEARMESEVVWGFRSDPSRRLHIHLRNLSLPVIAELTPLPDDVFEGFCDLEMGIAPGPLWQFEVHARAAQLSVHGVALQSVTLPFRGTVLPSFQRGELAFRSAGATLAGGRIEGQASLKWGDRRQVQGELTFSRVDTKSLVQQGLGPELPGDGHLSGTIQLQGTNMLAWSETAVLIDAQLSGSQPRRLPIVEALQSVVGNISFSQPTDEGRIVTRYLRGTWSLMDTTLSGPTIEMIINGTISANRRLNLEFIVRTGRRSFDRRLTHFAGGQLGDRLWGLLADRLLRIQVTGTIDRPIVYAKPLSLVDVKVKQ